MKKYHVIFKDETTDFFSKGDLIDAEDEVVAILKFRDKFPNVIFLGMFSTILLKSIPSSN